MYVYLAFVFVLLVLCCFTSLFSRTQESTMNAILAKEWHWVVRHTRIRVGEQDMLLNERIDAAYTTFASEAIEYVAKRHPLKGNMVLTAYACRNADERFIARQLHDMVSRRIAAFEQEMTQLEQRMH